MAEPEAAELTDRDRAMLDFEDAHRQPGGGKEGAVRDKFDMRYSRYHQLLNQIIDKPAALKYNPMLVKSLLSARAARVSARSRRAFTRSSAR